MQKNEENYGNRDVSDVALGQSIPEMLGVSRSWEEARTGASLELSMAGTWHWQYPVWGIVLLFCFVSVF